MHNVWNVYVHFSYFYSAVCTTQTDQNIYRWTKQFCWQRMLKLSLLKGTKTRCMKNNWTISPTAYICSRDYCCFLTCTSMSSLINFALCPCKHFYQPCYIKVSPNHPIHHRYTLGLRNVTIVLSSVIFTEDKRVMYILTTPDRTLRCPEETNVGIAPASPSEYQPVL